eukprot:749126-Hanusia_phi.AAC.2
MQAGDVEEEEEREEEENFADALDEVERIIACTQADGQAVLAEERRGQDGEAEEELMKSSDPKDFAVFPQVDGADGEEREHSKGKRKGREMTWSDRLSGTGHTDKKRERREAVAKQYDRSRRLLQKAMKLREKHKQAKRSLQLELSVRLDFDDDDDDDDDVLMVCEP